MVLFEVCWWLHDMLITSLSLLHVTTTTTETEDTPTAGFGSLTIICYTIS